jgi:glutamyl/glutaminyl-tRNA synthetase
MGRKTRVSKGKTMKPNFFVFCEGETEVTYVKFLRSIYRVPIQIIPKKSDSNISNKYIENCKRDYVTTSNDKIFLMFDLDVEGMLENLQKIANAILLVSNPSIELWFLLHYEDCKAELSSAECIQKLKKHSANYSKGSLTNIGKTVLYENTAIATNRAKRLPSPKNPSSTIHELIEKLNQIVQM